MKLAKCVRALLALALVISLCTQQAEAKKVLHAYTLCRVPVLSSGGKKVATLEKGITIQYSAVKGSRVQFNYYGKKRYLQSKYLVLDGRLEQYVASHQNSFELKATTKIDLSVYSDSGLKKKLKSIKKGETFKVFAKRSGLYKVQLDGRFGYVPSSLTRAKIYVDVTTFPTFSGSTKGERIANFGKKFVGNPYVWGGTSLTGGCDCSGFVQQVYKRFGYTLPRCSREQAKVGKAVSFSKLRPGDLIFYKRGSRIGHVTLYIGDGKVVQARGSRYGIVITDYDYNKPAWARRII